MNMYNTHISASLRMGMGGASLCRSRTNADIADGHLARVLRAGRRTGAGTVNEELIEPMPMPRMMHGDVERASFSHTYIHRYVHTCA